MARSSRYSMASVTFTWLARFAIPCTTTGRTGNSMRNRDQKSETGVQRVSPLAGVAIQGRFGADRGEPGVELSVRHPVSIVTIIARQGKEEALAKSLRGLKICAIQWAGAEQYFAIADGRAEGILYRELKEK